MRRNRLMVYSREMSAQIDSYTVISLVLEQ